MSKVISISREFGSGGREIGYRLAKKLGIPFYDKEIISMAAEDSNISEEIFHANDEVIGHKERIDYQYAVIDPFSSTYEVPVSDQLLCDPVPDHQKNGQSGPLCHHRTLLGRDRGRLVLRVHLLQLKKAGGTAALPGTG